MQSVTLRINNIACRYDAANVLENIDFSAKGGDFIGVVGPNASGKSTLLKSISKWNNRICGSRNTPYYENFGRA